MRKIPVFLLFLVLFLISFSVLAQNDNFTPPSAIDYAPNFWFDSEEKYYPVNPLDFYFENGLEIIGQIAVDKYNQLSFEQKLNQMTVFYYIKDEGNQWVYQYWFFYVFNDFPKLIKNKHYGDWESVFVFVDKDSKKVIKVIGTAHQRKLFDTEIYNPENNNIWSYIGNGSHANCIDEKDDGYCDRKRWRLVEKWDKNGPKISYDSYNLQEINLDFINGFEGAISLEKSTELGINIFDFFKTSEKEFYISLGGKPPIHAWEQESFYNPEVLSPISWKYIVEKIDQTKDKIIGFFKNIESDQQAAISSSLYTPLEHILISIVSETIEEELNEQEIIPIIEKSIDLVEPELIIPELIVDKEIKEEFEVEEVEEIEKSQPIVQPTPPMGFPFFIGGSGAPSVETEPEVLPTPEVPADEAEPLPAEAPSGAEEGEPDTTPPAAIADLSASSGDSRGTINLSWTSPGADQYIIKYATSSEITLLNWASSTDIIGELTPSSASTTESLTISNLTLGQTYYWAIKSKDEAGNISDLSNIASTTPSALANYVIINEVQLGSNEFVELYNPTDQAIDMTGWYWSYFSYNRDWNNPNLNERFPNGASISPKGYYLIGLSGYPESNGYVDADWQVYVSDQLHYQKGSVAIFSSNPSITTPELAKEGLIDAIGWGAVDYVLERNSVLAVISNKTLTRQINGWDTDNNSNDFIESNWPTPQNLQGDKAAIIDDSFSFTQDTTWTLNDNTYILISNSNAYPTVESGAVLTIEPGVIIKGSNKYYPSLIIKGTLKAEGTNNEHITFTSATTTQLAGDWSGIIFDNSTSTESVLDYVNFEYGGYQVSYGGYNNIKEIVKIDNSLVEIKNSSFSNSLYNGIRLVNSNFTISDSAFNNNFLSGIIIDGGSPTINNCEFENNDIGIEIINQASP
ncbi:MAG: lamin tail domain-containing protein, partial [Patescibacteria group bacterium]